MFARPPLSRAACLTVTASPFAHSRLQAWPRPFDDSAAQLQTVCGRSQIRRLSKKSRASGRQWLRQQVTDRFVKERQKRKLRARSAFKLEELDDKFQLFKPQRRVVDLGAAPGGWAQIAKERCPQGTIVALDLLPIKPLPGVLTMQGDFTCPEVRNALHDALEGKPVDVVICDMAHDFVGDSVADHLSQLELCYQALEFAVAVLEPRRGKFVTKVISGVEQKELECAFRASFETVRMFKPEASRSQSSEFYMFGHRLLPDADPSVRTPQDRPKLTEPCPSSMRKNERIAALDDSSSSSREPTRAQMTGGVVIYSSKSRILKPIKKKNRRRWFNNNKR